MKIKRKNYVWKRWLRRLNETGSANARAYAKNAREIAQLEVTGESGAGLVKVTINGAHNCRRIEIDPSLMEDDKEMVEDLVAAAFNNAVRRAEEMQKRKWQV